GRPLPANSLFACAEATRMSVPTSVSFREACVDRTEPYGSEAVASRHAAMSIADGFWWLTRPRRWRSVETRELLRSGQATRSDRGCRWSRHLKVACAGLGRL